MDPRVTALHSIMPIDNVRSVLQHGILSHARAGRLPRHWVALKPVRDGRDLKSVPQGMKLHEYANLYFRAHHPALMARREEGTALCVLSVAIDVLHSPGVVITDGDAANDYVRYLAPSQWAVLDFDAIYGDPGQDGEDPARLYQRRSRRCAEVLVPDRVEPRFLTGASVADSEGSALLHAAGFCLPVAIDPGSFGRD